MAIENYDVSFMAEIAYGNYHGCEKCGSSELVNGDGWGCVCDLLIYYGNCKKCVLSHEYCKCSNDDDDNCRLSDEEDILPFGMASSYRFSNHMDDYVRICSYQDN